MTRRRPMRRQQHAPGWVWMLFGLALGLLVALFVFVQSGAPLRLATPAARPAQAPTPARSAPAADGPSAEPPPAARFDFYEVLPQFEVVIPEVETEPRADRTPGAVEEAGRYVLQVGSFREQRDADRRQANLALLGIESWIQRVMIDADVFHRVRIGPIAELTELNRVREQLREARIESLLMKVPE